MVHSHAMVASSSSDPESQKPHAAGEDEELVRPWDLAAATGHALGSMQTGVVIVIAEQRLPLAERKEFILLIVFITLNLATPEIRKAFTKLGKFGMQGLKMPEGDEKFEWHTWVFFRFVLLLVFRASYSVIQLAVGIEVAILLFKYEADIDLPGLQPGNADFILTLARVLLFAALVPVVFFVVFHACLWPVYATLASKNSKERTKMLFSPPAPSAY